jgi:poly-beta-1,6-N-acetyl-D-glucosamine synthase
LINLILSIINFEFMTLFVIQFLIKSLVDYILLARSNQFFKTKKMLCYFIPAQIFNIVLIPYEAMAGVVRSVKWKDRTYVT